MSTQYIRYPTPGSGSSGSVSLTSGVTGVLPLANGGTGAVDLNTAGIWVNGSNTFGAASSLGNSDQFTLNFLTNNTIQMTISSNSAKVGIGTTNPFVGMHVASVGATVIDHGFIQENNGSGNFGGAFIGRRSRGTIASQTAVQSGDFIGLFGAQGFGQTTYGTLPSGFARFTAAQNFSDTTKGTNLDILLTSNGSQTARIVTKFLNDGGISLYDGNQSGLNFFTQYCTAGTTPYSIRWPAIQGSSTSTHLVNDGTGNLTWGLAPGVTVQTFSSGSGMYNPPTGVVALKVTIIGGGGGGGGCASGAVASGAGSGGGGGGTAISWPLYGSFSYYVGDGGAGGTAGNNAGTTGTSSFLGGISAGGGIGGGGSAASATVQVTGVGGAGGMASNGNVNVVGGAGTSGLILSATSSLGGCGGASTMAGQAQAGVNSNAAGAAGNGPGGGGSGGDQLNGGGNQAGGKGAPGIIIVEEYYA